MKTKTIYFALPSYLVIITFLFLTPLTASSQPPPKKPNVLFILVDDLRPALGCYGDPLAHSPNIDALAARSISFTRAYTQQAVCSPSRTALLTGLRPDETGVYNLETHFRERLPDATTLPQLFKAGGYNVVGLGKVFHTNKSTLDSVSWTRVVPDYGNITYVLPENPMGKGKQKATEEADVNDEAYEDGRIAKGAVEALEQLAQSEQPFFLAVGFRKPHSPYSSPKKYWDLYERSSFQVTHRERPTGAPELAFHQNQELRGYRDIGTAEIIPQEKEREVLHGYYACVSYIDAQIGKVMSQLKSLNLLDNTIIVLWGDHGYHLGEQGQWCKSTNFELATRIPLIVSYPGMPKKGTKSDAIVETVDIYPTLADLCDLKPQGKLSGTSFKEILDRPQRTGDFVAFSQFVRPYNAINKQNARTHMGYSVRKGEWRCTYWYDVQSNLVERELYRLKRGEKSETANLAGQPAYKTIEQELAGLIDTYRRGQYTKQSFTATKGTN
ncbi:MAG TPA: sulfatase [Chryseolinea sp.]|nr:sulfatase [Chryseolinea sp.]